MQRALAVLLIAASAVLLFWRLDAVPLWRDEGTTAVWARQMVDSGSLAPYVYDFDKGQLLVQAADGHDVNSKLLPAMQSYLQFYVVALSFKLFGVSVWTARAPLAVIGALLLFVLYRIGALLYGKSSVLALAAPGLALTSIFFLHGARQARYYGLVAFAASLILYEMVRYIEDRTLVDSKAFWARLAGWGLLLYFSNYLSFVGAWASVGAFVILERDTRLFKRFVAISAAMAVIVLTDFALLHAEFASTWPPPPDRSLWEIYRGALISRTRDFWRDFPLVLLVPVGGWLYLTRERTSGLAKGLFAVAAAIVIAPVFLFSAADFGAWPAPAFWLAYLVCLGVPGLFLWAWSTIRDPAPLTRAALLGGVMLVLSALITIAAGQGQVNLRHCYQVLPAGVLLATAVVGGVARRKGAAPAVAVFIGMAAWPNLDFMLGGTEETVQRQYLADDSYIEPLFDFFEGKLEPGARVAFARNVKGMPFYFRHPEIRWVGLLDGAAPHNAEFRGRIPDDQFKEYADADWWVVWDRRDEPAPGLNDTNYEKIWEYSYASLYGWWDRNAAPNIRTYEVWKRRN